MNNPIVPSKCHNGQTITIQAIDGTLDEGLFLKGKYEHLERSKQFAFVYSANGYRAILSRDEWEVTQS